MVKRIKRKLGVKRIRPSLLGNPHMQGRGGGLPAHGTRGRDPGRFEPDDGEGYLAYTELDPGNDIDITETKISFSGLPLDENLYVMKDYGAGYFGNFVHRFVVHIESFTYADAATAYGGSALLYALSEKSLHTQSAFEADNADGLRMSFFGTPTIWGFALRNYDGWQGVGNWYSNASPPCPTPPFTLYAEVTRYKGILTVKFYSDSGYSTLVHTVMAPCGVTALRYHTPLGGVFGAADDDVLTGYIENFVESAASEPTPAYVAVDLTTYTEVDENSDMTVTASKADVTTLRADANTYLMNDYGVDAIGEFAHRFKVNWSGVNATGYGPKAAVWSITAGANHTIKLQSNNDDGVNLLIASNGAGDGFSITLRDDDTSDWDGFTIDSLPATFWVEVKRVGNHVFARLFSDAYSTVFGSLVVVINTGDYRFHQAVAGLDIGSYDDDITFYVEDYEIDNIVS